MKSKKIKLRFLMILFGIITFVSGCEDSTKPKPVKQRSDQEITNKHQPISSVNSTSETDVLELNNQVANAKKITKQFSSLLKSELQNAMKNGGPINAISVCHTKALPITDKVAKAEGVKLSRVSLKPRNPINAPLDWQETILKDFDARAAQGEDIKTMAYAKIINAGGKQQFQFMKALPSSGVCLTCHGSELAPSLSAKLVELCPNDKAIGYMLGQVRGAIVIVNDIE